METLKLKQNISKKPKLYYYRKFSKKLSKQKDSIIHLKLHYKKNFATLRLNYILPLEYEFDSKWNPIARAIEQYLDVLIIPYEYLSQNKPKRSISIVGAQDQIIFTANLINQIYHLFWGSIERKRRHIRLLHRQLRRRKRKNNPSVSGVLPDARVKISSFKSRLLGFLEDEIRKQSDTFNTDRKIKIKGSLRLKRIKSYIWRKYKKRWRFRL